MVAFAVVAPLGIVIGNASPAGAATGGYPWASATCQGTPLTYNGTQYCPNDNWVYNSGLFDSWGYNYRNCTSWVAWRLSTNNGYTMPRAIGDASAWGGYFSSHGVVVNHTPAIGAIAWESGGDHVAYVESVVSGGSQVTISEYNEAYYPGRPTAGDGLYDTRPVATSAFEYIHVKDLSGGGGYEAAFEANTTSLWTAGSAGTGDHGLGMMRGTSPSIAALPGGGYEIAFQANTGSLWTTGSAGTANWGLGMMAGSSPSITALPNGSYEAAFEANTTSLWTAGSAGTGDHGLGMMSGTSPSITG